MHRENECQTPEEARRDVRIVNHHEAADLEPVRREVPVQEGYGKGMIVQRGFSPPPSFHQDRLRNAPVGHFFDVITNGYGAMYSYADRIPVDDRWAIIAYVRALQLSNLAVQNEELHVTVNGAVEIR